MKKIAYFIILLYSFFLISCAETSSKKYSDEQGNTYVLAEKIEELTSKTTALVLKDTLNVLPDEIFDFPQLKVLILKGNKLKLLPDKIATLKDLEVFDVSDNQLIVLNKGISELRKLRIFDASNNEKLFALPKGFEKLKNIEALRLDKTEILQVPKQIFASLEVLHLGTDTCDSLFLESNKLKEFVSIRGTPWGLYDTNNYVDFSPKLLNLKKIEKLALYCSFLKIRLKDFCKLTSLKNLTLISIMDYENVKGKRVVFGHNSNFEAYYGKIKKELQQCLPNCNIKIEVIPTEIPKIKHLEIFRNSNNPILKKAELAYAKKPNDPNLKSTLINFYCNTVIAQLGINEIEEAAIFLNKAEQLNVNAPEVVRAKAFLLIFQNKFEEAKLLLPVIKSEQYYVMKMEEILFGTILEDNVLSEKTKNALIEYKKLW